MATLLFEKTIVLFRLIGFKSDSFLVPTYLFMKDDERLGRNDVKVAGQAGKGKRKVGTLSDFRAAFP